LHLTYLSFYTCVIYHLSSFFFFFFFLCCKFFFYTLGIYICFTCGLLATIFSLPLFLSSFMYIDDFYMFVYSRFCNSNLRKTFTLFFFVWFINKNLLIQNNFSLNPSTMEVIIGTMTRQSDTNKNDTKK